MSFEDPTDEEFRLLAVLESMCGQYLGDYYGRANHDFMSAGEHAIHLLERYGVIIRDAGGGVWTTRARVLQGLDDEDLSNVEAIRAEFNALPTDEPVEGQFGLNPTQPDLSFQGLNLWFTGLAKNKARPRPSFMPELEADRLDVTVRLNLIEGSSSLSGELLTLRDLQTFRNQLARLASKTSGKAVLSGFKETVHIELRRRAADKFEGRIATHYPAFKQRVEKLFDFENIPVVERAIAQLDQVLAKFA